MDQTPFEIATQAVKDTERLQKARREFAKLQADEKKYIGEREARANEYLKEVHEKIEAAESIFDKIMDILSTALSRAETTAQSSEDAASKMKVSAMKLVARATHLKRRTEDALQEAKKRIDAADRQTTKNSAEEKRLKTESNRVEKKDKEASAKLAEAEDLAFWHKKPGAKYKGKN